MKKETYNQYRTTTPDECIAIVKECGYKTRNQLRTNDRKLYHRMEVLGCLGDCFGELEGKYNKRSKEDICNEAKTYGTSERLLKENKTLWGRLWRNGWLKDTFGEKEKPITQYTPEECFAVIDEFYIEHPEVDKSPMAFQQNHPHGVTIMNRMWELKCSKDYPWELYKERTILNPIFRPLLENVPRAIALPSALYLYMVEAVGDKTLAGRLLKKIAKTDADTGDRQAIVELLKEKQNEVIDDTGLQKVVEETPDADTTVKENDEPTIENKEEVDISKEMAEKQLTNIKAQGEYINQVLRSPKMYNIFNSGDTLKSMLTFMQNELMRLVCAGYKDIVEKFIAENK